MSTAHPGFKRVAAGIARRQGVSPKRAGAILGAATRRASASARRKNPRLNKVKGYACGGMVNKKTTQHGGRVVSD